MNKVISLKGLRLKKRKNIYSHPKRNLDINPQEKAIDFYKTFISIASITFVLIGALIYSKKSSSFLIEYLNKMINIFQSEAFGDIFKLLILSEFIFLVLCFFLGTNLFGSITVSIVPIFKTFLIGYVGAYMYNNYELNGVLFSLIFLVPYFSATCTSLIILTNESYIMSKSLSSGILQKKTYKDAGLRLFLLRFILIIFSDLIFMLIETLLLTSFGAKISLR